MQRRTLLKTVGGIGVTAAVGGAGLIASSGGAAASSINVNASSTQLVNDDGDVQQVYIDPELTISWNDFDDAVGAVSIFIEAKVEGGPTGPNSEGFFPLSRSEPLLAPGGTTGMSYSAPGTTGNLDIGPFSDLSGNRVDGMGWSSGTSPEGWLRVADAEAGAPDYSGASEGYLQGANVSNNTIPSGEPLVNGEYGAASGTTPFENVNDGTGSGPTKVHLRYTVQLIKMGISHFEQITGYDLVGDEETAWGNSPVTVGEVYDRLEALHDSTAEEWNSDTLNNTSWLSDVQPEDIAVVGYDTNAQETTTDNGDPVFLENQKELAMTGDGDYPAVASPGNRSAQAARDYETTNEIDHPAVLTAGDDESLSFNVVVVNQQSGSSGSGNSNGGVIGNDESTPTPE